MRYYQAPAFEKSLKGLDAPRKERVRKAIRLAVAFFETGDLPQGLGLKALQGTLWEIRAGLSDRIIFRKDHDTLQFILVGSHIPKVSGISLI